MKNLPRSGRNRLWPWVLGLCGLAIVIGVAFFIRPTSHSTEKESFGAEPVATKISIQNMQFYPASVEIKKGDVVEWTNLDMVAHTVTSASFDSSALISGQTWRHAFTETGNFPYTCTFHPTMKGVVIVK